MLADGGNGSGAAQAHGTVEFAAIDVEHMLDPGLACNGKTPQMRPCHQAGGGAKRQRFENIGAAPDPAIDQNRNAAVDRFDDARKRADARGRAVELPAAMIGNDDAVNAMIERALWLRSD